MNTVRATPSGSRSPRPSKPIFEPETRNAPEILQFPRQKRAVVGHDDAGNSQVHRSDPQPALGQIIERIRCRLVPREDRAFPSDQEKIVKSAITMEQQFFVRSGLFNAAEPAPRLLFERYDRYGRPLFVRSETS